MILITGQGKQGEPSMFKLVLVVWHLMMSNQPINQTNKQKLKSSNKFKFKLFDWVGKESARLLHVCLSWLAVHF